MFYMNALPTLYVTDNLFQHAILTVFKWAGLQNHL